MSLNRWTSKFKVHHRWAGAGIVLSASAGWIKAENNRSLVYVTLGILALVCFGISYHLTGRSK